jgi:hypothetical protein
MVNYSPEEVTKAVGQSSPLTCSKAGRMIFRHAAMLTDDG